jgi:hypothetical protein
VKGIHKGIILCIVLICLIPLSSAFNLSARTGETWIIYQWETGHTVNIYIDGIRQVNSTTSIDWYLTDINSDEKHQIKLYNATNPSQLLGSLTVTTLHSQFIILILICILIIFFIVLLYLQDPIKVILVGGLAAAISLYTSQIAIGYGALTIIPLVCLIVSAIFIAYALWKIIIEKTQW